MQISRTAAILALIATPAIAGAQQTPAVRQIGAIVAKSAEPEVIAGVRVLPGRGVLVNDTRGRRVLLFEPTLERFTVVADSTTATGNAYSGRVGGLIRFRGDSTLFVDPQSMSMLVIGPDGRIARVMSVPGTQDVISLANPIAGGSQYDPAGRLVYRAQGMMGMNRTRIVGGGAGAGAGPPMPPEQPDSVPLARIDLATRQVDTVAYIRVPRVRFNVNRSEDGTTTMTSVVNPLPVVDDWTVLTDGTIAIVRGADYRVDFIAPDGTKRSSPRVPFEWQRLSDEDKSAFMDSVKVAYERRAAATAAAGGTPTPGATMMPGGGGGAGGQVLVFREGPPGGARGGAAPAMPTGMPQVGFVSPEELPDYRPAFFAGAAISDNDGNVWIRTTKTNGAGPIYDVIDREGRLVDRVEVPTGRSVVGFDGEFAYLGSREGNKAVLERARLR